jgi:succinate-semialdehyde dehydrogenase/glutarate-semialdehyde dehydrogenase
MLFRVADIDEAIAVANDTPFGLGASVWTRSRIDQKRFAATLQSGAVFVNTPVASDPRLPFGGVKHSGYGRELSTAGIREFLNAKTVVIKEQSAADRATDRTAMEPESADEDSFKLSGNTSTPHSSRKKERPERIHIPFLAEEH